jgi:HSP20 family protein
MKKTETGLARTANEPFGLLRQMTSELDHFFEGPFFGSAFKWPTFSTKALGDVVNWSPNIDVYEKDNRLFTKVDLPGLKKEEVKVEVTDGYLAISGERKAETEEKKANVYRCERSYGSFYRAVPMPEGAKVEDVKATFADGVLEVSVPLPAKPAANLHKDEIEEPKAKAAA